MAGIGASCPLPWRPAKVPSPNRYQAVASCRSQFARPVTLIARNAIIPRLKPGHLTLRLFSALSLGTRSAEVCRRPHEASLCPRRILRQQLPQYRDDRVGPAVVALNDPGQFVAPRNPLADTLDDDIDNLVLTAMIDEIPPDPDRCGAGPLDLAAHDHLACGTKRDPSELHPRSGILAESGCIGLCGIFPEQIHEFLLLLRVQVAPVESQGKLGDPRHVESGLEQLPERDNALRRRNVRRRRLQALCADTVNEVPRILCGRARPRRHDERRCQEQTTDDEEASHHLDLVGSGYLLRLYVGSAADADITGSSRI